MRIQTRELSRAEFQSMGDAWADCLERSNADRLFMSWPWLYSWWETWSDVMGLELILIGAYENQKLVGIGPFFRHRYRTPVGFKIDRIHALGNAWRIGPTVRTEYTGLIVDELHKHDTMAAILTHLSKLKWDELVVSDVLPEEADSWAANLQSGPGNVLVLRRSQDHGVVVDTSKDMTDWLKSLGSNTRLKLYNRREYLASKGKLEVRCVEGEGETKQFFEQLNSFHLVRWGKPCFDPLAVNFHLKLRSRMTGSQAPCYSIMSFNDQPISVLYDVRAGERIYNLQSGYEQNFDPKVSLGTLHFGYGIEDAFKAAQYTGYDLLAGYGKSTFYKQHLRGAFVTFKTVQFIRNPLLRFIYKQQAKLPHFLRQPLNRFFRL